MAAAIALAVVLLASVNFDLPAQDVFQSLRFHLAVAALVLPPILWILGARLRAVLVLVSAFASLGHGAWIVHEQQSLRTAFAASDQLTSFRVLSFNVLANSEQGQNVADYMISLLPDVVAIMESPGIERALDRLAETFPYRIGCDNTETCDLSLFSRTPFSSATMHGLGPELRERLITATTTINGRPVNIVALHLTKPYFDAAAAAELWDISHVIEQMEGPVVVMGDFNSAAWAGNVARFIRRNDLMPPPAYPATWPIRLGPLGVPIDNIFSGQGLQIESIERTPQTFGSNHFGLVARVIQVP